MRWVWGNAGFGLQILMFVCDHSRHSENGLPWGNILELIVAWSLGRQTKSSCQTGDAIQLRRVVPFDEFYLKMVIFRKLGGNVRRLHINGRPKPFL